VRALAGVQRQDEGKGEEKVNFLAQRSSQALETALLAGCKTTKWCEKKELNAFPP